METSSQIEKINLFIDKILDANEDQAFYFSDKLAEIGSEEVIQALLSNIENPNGEIRYLISRTLSKIENNELALEPLLEAINNPDFKDSNGGMVEALIGFDCSEIFVKILKIYLYGNFKASSIAKYILDTEEFNIKPRVIKKAEKNWNHYVNNVKHDDAFLEKKEEVEDILKDLNSLFEEEQD